MSTSAAPEGFHTVTPYLLVADVPALLAFVTAAFDAEEIMRDTRPDGTVAHAQVRIGDSMVMMGAAQDDFPPMPAMLYLYVADVDAGHAQAVAAGGVSIYEPHDESYGDRAAGVRDAQGNLWWLAAPIRQS